MVGLAPDVKFIAEGMIRGSMGLLDTMRGARDTAIAVGHELARQHGMAGDDEAGRAFAKVYVSAAPATLDKMGFSSYVLGETSKGLIRNARELPHTGPGRGDTGEAGQDQQSGEDLMGPGRRLHVRG
ncbi:hypothetical protein [Streptomyces sp. QHH-9511]|uniref:hypothetical protein n=1 Tax=Streptomyces sp. QHH-9511 TaxID=2684468 RepID=UPI001E576429|nr:hypothetical protein [Streptomyces sp. QHH-9511]